MNASITMKSIQILVGISLLALGCQKKTPAVKSDTNYLDTAYIEILDPDINKVLNPGNQLEILSEGHDWTEGPLWLAKEQKVIFSDIPRNTVYSWDEVHGLKEYLKPSGFTGENFEGKEPGANGLLLDPEGYLVLCQHGNRQVARMNGSLDKPKPEYTPVVDRFEGKRLNSPNDAIYDSKGNLYFTDPPYGLPNQMEDTHKELDFQGVYKLSSSGNLEVLDEQLSRPNGIAFSPDEKTLYVANSDPENAIWMAYNMDDTGKVMSKRLFFDATNLVHSEKGLPDGLKVNKEGYLFATGPGGVYIFDPAGKHLGTIKTGQATANVALNGDQSVLFITADAYLLKLNLQ